MSYGSMPAGRAIEGTNSGLLREPNSNARGGRKRSRRAVLFSVVWSRLVMNRPLIGERAAKCGPPLLRSPPGVWRASQLRQFLGAQLTKSCRAGGSNALFLGWSQFPEFEEEQEVVGPLQRAAYDEGPAEAQKGQEVTRKKRAQGRGEASWNRGQTGGRRPLSWRHHRHDIGAARRHIHL